MLNVSSVKILCVKYINEIVMAVKSISVRNATRRYLRIVKTSTTVAFQIRSSIASGTVGTQPATLINFDFLNSLISMTR